MHIDHAKKGNVLVIKPKEKRIDALIAPDFKSRMVEFVAQGNMGLVLNLSEVDLIDSSGLGVMVSVLKRLGNKGSMKLCNVKPDVRSLLELIQLDKVFLIYHSEQEAVDSF